MHSTAAAKSLMLRVGQCPPSRAAAGLPPERSPSSSPRRADGRIGRRGSHPAESQNRSERPAPNRHVEAQPQGDNVKSIVGPFLPDPNVSVLLLSLDDRLWIINRRANHDEPSLPMFGLLEFLDVRAHRVQSGGDYLDAAPGAWATEASNSEYWEQVVRSDEQRTAEQLAQHKHYVVRDGNHRTVDVIAREIGVRSLPGELLPELQRLAEEFARDFE